MEIDLSQFHQVFFEESLEGLEVMEQELLHLEEDSDKENINTIFRAAHSIKGGSATFGFKQVSEFTHVLETLLDEMRDGKRPVSKSVVDLLLQSVDCLRGMFAKIQDGDEVGDTHLELLGYFNELLEDNRGTEHRTVGVESQDLDNTAVGNRFLIRFKPASYILQTGNEPARMFRELEAFGELHVKVHTEDVPDFDALEPENCYLWWQLLLAGDVSEPQIREVFEWVEDDCELIIERSAYSAEEFYSAGESDHEISNVETKKADEISQPDIDENTLQSHTSEKQGVAKSVTPPDNILTKVENEKDNQGKVKPKVSSSIRVGTDKVDQLIDLVGELVITQSMLSELGENFDMKKVNQLISGLAELEQNTRELQESVMRIRMLPIGFVFNRLPRMVRDLSAKLDKLVDLEILGETTELDKTVLEQIGDPLTHLVRNALDHGIEIPQKRVDAGKNATGRLTLNAYHQGGNIVIEIKDDGAGINPEVIFNKAVEKGLISAKADLPPDQILGLIMEPGFSTAEVVSDVSGRGVGMDVVKRNINNLGGSVEIASEFGRGTTFTIRLPLTLSILEGQLVRVANEVYILPLVSILESIPIREDSLRKVARDIRIYKFDNEYVPVVDLVSEFELRPAIDSSNSKLLAIVSNENKKLAILIDELLGQQQVVIKSLENHYKSISGVSGATILGDGRVALILDVAGLAKRTSGIQQPAQTEVA